MPWNLSWSDELGLADSGRSSEREMVGGLRRRGYCAVLGEAHRSSILTLLVHQYLHHRQPLILSSEQSSFTLLHQDAFQKRIFISKHQALIRSRAMALLKVLQSVFMMLYGRFQLFDILGPSLSKCSLSLPIPLLSFFRCGIDLKCTS